METFTIHRCFTMPSFSTAFLGFTLVSAGFLLLIVAVKVPAMLRSGRRFFRQMAARRTREARMLADLEKLMAEARRLEGIYCFEGPEGDDEDAVFADLEPHHRVSRPAAWKSAGSSQSPQSSLSSVAAAR